MGGWETPGVSRFGQSQVKKAIWGLPVKDALTSEFPIWTDVKKQMGQGHISRTPLVAQHECTPWHTINVFSFLQQLRNRTQHSGAICAYGKWPPTSASHPPRTISKKTTWLLLCKELVKWRLSFLAAKRILGGACFKNACVELGVGRGADYQEAQGEFGGMLEMLFLTVVVHLSDWVLQRS